MDILSENELSGNSNSIVSSGAETSIFWDKQVMGPFDKLIRVNMLARMLGMDGQPDRQMDRLRWQ